MFAKHFDRLKPVVDRDHCSPLNYYIMEIIKKIESDFVAALKTKNEHAKSTLSLLKNKVAALVKEKKDAVSHTDIVLLVKNQIKQREQSIIEFVKGERYDLVEKENKEKEILESYLPKQFTESELKEKIQEIIETENLSGSDLNKMMGLIMGKLNKQYAGLFDNKLASKLIKETK